MAIEELNQMFVNQCKYTLNEFNEITIKENENLGSGDDVLKKVTIKHCLPSLIAIKLDKFNPTSKYFKTATPDINKGCDCVVIVTDYEDQNYILFCELKSKSINKKDVANKFVCSSSFIKYINNILIGVYNKTISDYQTAGITFKLSNNRIRKARIRPQQNDFDITNDNYSYKGKSIQVLEISKSSPKNFNLPLSLLINKIRPKKMKNWP